MTPAQGPIPERSEDERWGGIEKNDDRCLELSLPARAELRSLLRMAVASVASNIGFDLDTIADLRVALDELCNSCALGATDASVMRLACYWSQEGIYVECSVSNLGSAQALREDEDLPPGMRQNELSEGILAALVDGYGISELDHQSRQAWLRKRRQSLDRAAPGKEEPDAT